MCVSVAVVFVIITKYHAKCVPHTQTHRMRYVLAIIKNNNHEARANATTQQLGQRSTTERTSNEAGYVGDPAAQEFSLLFYWGLLACIDKLTVAKMRLLCHGGKDTEVASEFYHRRAQNMDNEQVQHRWSVA